MKTLIVVRHAHRDKSDGREADNGISEKGKSQVSKLTKYYESRFEENEKPVLLSSPKKRCVETLNKIAKVAGTKVEANELLDEQQDHESTRDMQKRIEAFLDEWKKSKDPLTIISSHGDWIPMFMEEAIGIPADLKKAGWAEIDSDKGELKLTRLIQEWN